ncbi:MAG: acetolactate synthase small subunit [Gammaproteobacteria bacterium]|nr:acetolactate synthase small subunit [Gammaproteobacteria bacterium]MCP5140228.1 acetolactate synthase small subunit [Chromatiales bacterium]
MRHIISILLRNEAGALTRVAALFSTRGYNIESLNVAPTEDPLVSRLTLVTLGSDHVVRQINNQLLKLIDVVSIFDLTEGDHIERELLLLKLRVEDKELERMRELVQTEGARILDDRLDSYTLELTGAAARLDNFINRAAVHAEIRSVVRSGPLAVRRGAPAHSSAT